MVAISRSQLKRFSGVTETKAFRSLAEVSVFLSFSHKDKDLVRSVKGLLGSQGVSVYIDLLDDGLPEITNAETARALKSKICSNGKFLLLATDNSLASKWVPWELGVADGCKGPKDILILPVKPDYGEYQGNEYVKLYSQITMGGLSNALVESAEASIPTKSLRTWLSA